jgi:hypothetical protein
LKKKFNGFIGTCNRDLPACSLLPQPTTLPRPLKMSFKEICKMVYGIQIVLHSECRPYYRPAWLLPVRYGRIPRNVSTACAKRRIKRVLLRTSDGPHFSLSSYPLAGSAVKNNFAQCTDANTSRRIVKHKTMYGLIWTHEV